MRAYSVRGGLRNAYVQCARWVAQCVRTVCAVGCAMRTCSVRGGARNAYIQCARWGGQCVHTVCMVEHTIDNALVVV